MPKVRRVLHKGAFGDEEPMGQPQDLNRGFITGRQLLAVHGNLPRASGCPPAPPFFDR